MADIYARRQKVAQERVAAAIAAGQRKFQDTDAFKADNIQLSSDEWVSKEAFNKLSIEDQDRLRELGIKGFNSYYAKKEADFKAANVELKSGEWVDKELYNLLDSMQKAKLEELGTEAFNKWRREYEKTQAQTQFRTVNVQLDSGEWVNRAAFNKLARYQQLLVNLLGISDYSLMSQGKPIKGTYVKNPAARAHLQGQTDESSLRAYNDFRTGWINRLRAAGAPDNVIYNFKVSAFWGAGGSPAAGIALAGLMPGVAGAPQVPMPKPTTQAEIIAAQRKYDQFVKDHEKHGGVWWTHADWKSMPIGDQILVEDKGYKGYKSVIEQRAAAFRKANIPVGKLADNKWISKVDFYNMPFMQRDVLKKTGWQGLDKYMSQQEKVLEPFVVEVNGEKHYDLVGAMRFEDGVYKDIVEKYKIIDPVRKIDTTPEEVHIALSSYFTPKQLAEVRADNLIKPKSKTEFGIYADELQIISEEISKPTSLEKATEGQVRLMGSIYGKMAEVDAVLSGKIKVSPETKVQLMKAVEAWDKVDSQWVEQNTNMLTTIGEFTESAKEWAMEEKGVKRAARAIPVALAEAIALIPASITGTMVSSTHDQIKALRAKDKDTAEEAQKASTSTMAGLSIGMMGWFAGRPYAIKENPYYALPYTTILILSPSRLASWAKAAKFKFDPKALSSSAVALEVDIGRVRTPKGMHPEKARQFVEKVQKAWTSEAPKAALEAWRTGRDVVIKTPDGKIIGHASGFQQSFPSTLFHVTPDAVKRFTGNLQKDGFIEVGAESQYGGLFLSGKPAFTFLGRRQPSDPGILGLMLSKTDIRDLPPRVASLLDKGRLAEAKTLFTNMGKRGELGDYVYPLWKWYGKLKKLEDEMWASPTFKMYKTDAPWHARVKGMPTGVTYTDSPMRYKTLKLGQKIPVLWVASKKALAEGRKIPSLKQLYKAELLSFVTGARQRAPWNVILRPWTREAEVPATGAMIASRFTGLSLHGVKTPRAKGAREIAKEATRHETWSKESIKEITREAEGKIDDIVREVEKKAREREAKGEKYEEAFTDEIAKMADRIIKEYERLERLPYYVKAPKLRLPIYGESRSEYAKRTEARMKPRLEGRITVSPKDRITVKAKGRPEIVTERSRAKTRYLQPRRTEAKEYRPLTLKGKRARVVYPKEPAYPERPVYPKRPEYPKEWIPGLPQPVPEPVIPVPVPVPLKSKFPELTSEKLEGALAWKQGWIYKLWTKPYGQKDIYNTKEPIPGVEYHDGIGSAARSVVRLHGELPPHIRRNMGIQDVHAFRAEKGQKKPRLRFTADPKQKTTAAGIVRVK